MPNLPSPVDQFIAQVNKRINSHRTRNIAIWATLIGGAIMLVLAAIYVLPGYRVPWILYPCVLVGTLLSAAVAVVLNRSSEAQAASFADSFFGLKNAIGSCLGFAQEGKQGGFYDVEKISYQPPWRLIVIGLVLVAVSVSLGFKGPSPEVEKRMEQEQQTLAMTVEANQQIKEMVEELQKSAEDEDERKLLEPDKLREWVDELKETTDLHEAKRQYSKIEMRLNRAAEALRQRRPQVQKVRKSG